MYTVKIENTYSDGWSETNEVVLPAPLATLDGWWEDVVYPETGTGYAVGRELRSHYLATIIASDTEEHLGETYEWSD